LRTINPRHPAVIDSFASLDKTSLPFQRERQSVLSQIDSSKRKAPRFEGIATTTTCSDDQPNLASLPVSSKRGDVSSLDDNLKSEEPTTRLIRGAGDDVITITKGHTLVSVRALEAMASTADPKTGNFRSKTLLYYSKFLADFLPCHFHRHRRCHPLAI